MQIDWFTFAAQIVNFLVLIALLRRFLYGPIIRAMREREEKIQSRMQEAEEQAQEAEEMKQSYQQKRQELENAREEKLEQAKQEAQAQRKQMIQRARDEVEQRRKQWREAIQRDQEALLSDIRHRVGEHACAVARHALTDIADTGLERQVVQNFISHLHEVSEDQWGEIKESIRGSDEELLVRNTFDMTEDAREDILDAIPPEIRDATEIRFETVDELICGVELRTDGYRIGWSVSDYLDTLEEAISQTLDEISSEERTPTAEDAEDGDSESEKEP